jgi:hypothetical protein
MIGAILSVLFVAGACVGVCAFAAGFAFARCVARGFV